MGLLAVYRFKMLSVPLGRQHEIFVNQWFYLLGKIPRPSQRDSLLYHHRLCPLVYTYYPDSETPSQHTLVGLKREKNSTIDP